ncbi:MAG: SAM-dependent methyltransferase, partial [Bdellovibrionota bacterium]
HYPHISFTGYEYVQERVVEGNLRLKKFVESLPAVSNRATTELEVADLTADDFKLKSADLYFIYDYGTNAAIRKTLDDLRQISLQRKIIVVGRGRASRDAIERETPWLSEVVKPEHFKNFSIYRSAE